MSVVEFQFELHQKIRVPALEVTGRVIAMSLGSDGKSYQVRYWWEGDARSIWLYADELEST